MRFIKKQIVIEAIQWTGRNLQEIADFVGPALQPIERRMDYKLKIRTLEGVMEVDAHDWIIKGVVGEFYPCKPHIFEMTYEAFNQSGDSHE